MDGNTPSILYHDGVEKFRGTYNECLMKLHNLQGQSWDYAFKYGGWTIEPICEDGLLPDGPVCPRCGGERSIGCRWWRVGSF